MTPTVYGKKVCHECSKALKGMAVYRQMRKRPRYFCDSTHVVDFCKRVYWKMPAGTYHYHMTESELMSAGFEKVRIA